MGEGFPRSTHKALVSGPPGPPTVCQALEGARNSRTGVGWCRRLRRWRWRRRWFCRRFVSSFVKLEITSFAFVNSFSSFLMVLRNHNFLHFIQFLLKEPVHAWLHNQKSKRVHDASMRWECCFAEVPDLSQNGYGKSFFLMKKICISLLSIFSKY